MSSSFDAINYSVRPSKSIERKIIFERVNRFCATAGIKLDGYIGLGSIWFSDFHIAHRLLGLNKLICLEREDGFSRVLFNKPFECINVIKGDSSVTLPTLPLRESKHLIWLDYDDPASSNILEDIKVIVSKVAPGSVFLFSMNAHHKITEKDEDKVQKFIEIMGNAAPPDLKMADLSKSKYIGTLSKSLFNYITHVLISSGRDELFIPLFNIQYADGVSMLSIGGVILARGVEIPSLQSLGISHDDWPDYNTSSALLAISAPPLTLREKMTLDGLLPRENKLKCSDIPFTIKDEQLNIYQQFYKYYPIFNEQVLS